MLCSPSLLCCSLAQGSVEISGLCWHHLNEASSLNHGTSRICGGSENNKSFALLLAERAPGVNTETLFFIFCRWNWKMISIEIGSSELTGGVSTSLLFTSHSCSSPDDNRIVRCDLIDWWIFNSAASSAASQLIMSSDTVQWVCGVVGGNLIIVDVGWLECVTLKHLKWKLKWLEVCYMKVAQIKQFNFAR